MSAILPVALACVPVGVAHAAVIVFGGAPTSEVGGAAIVFDPPSFNESDSYNPVSTGTDFMDGSTIDSVSGSISLGGSTVTSDANASYDMFLHFDGSGNVTNGTMKFKADSSVLLSSAIATDAGDYALTRANASTAAFLDFAITDVEVGLFASSSLLDQTLDNGVDDTDDALFYLADTTSGFTVLLSATDTRGDGMLTNTNHYSLLLPGHNYRMALSARVDHVCALTSGAPQPPCDLASLLLGPDDAGVTQSAESNLFFLLVPVPEPATAWLVAGGLAALGVRARRRS